MQIADLEGMKMKKWGFRRRARLLCLLPIGIYIYVFSTDVRNGLKVLQNIMWRRPTVFNNIPSTHLRDSEVENVRYGNQNVVSVGRLGPQKRPKISGPRFTGHVFEEISETPDGLDEQDADDVANGPYNAGPISDKAFPNRPRRNFRKALPLCSWNKAGFMYPAHTATRSLSQQRLAQLFNRLDLIYTPRDGSSIAAVRHGGVIPGDYDMDILIDMWTNEHVFSRLGCYHDRYPMDMKNTWVWHGYLDPTTWFCRCNWFKDLGPRQLLSAKETNGNRFSYFRNNTQSGDWEICRCKGTNKSALPPIPDDVPFIRTLTCNIMQRYKLLKKLLKETIKMHSLPMKIVDSEPENPLRHFAIHTFEKNLPLSWPKSFEPEQGVHDSLIKTYKVDIKLNWLRDVDLEGLHQYCRCKLDPNVEGTCLKKLPENLQRDYGDTWKNPLYSFEQFYYSNGTSTDFDVKGVCLGAETRKLWGEGHCSGWN
ncbi:hypothetical protein, variant [Sphaeroforma arctica JP610]|uniref:Uncharacterized protein n=1 Tax=Sphaeroforma arctica JP610 TaxID=667725 RepID=A0A0L0GDI9_9EUKA|nr:hypothetical protein, variant [Sphaeroforma arctica JP610]KNC86961.1 hypothetical protein, variant [Sphaeroforma arctica JP610]|eukprot:XP_014160864.1 hypothetical protein, variant [Sphaeroforma arctica JP610]